MAKIQIRIRDKDKKVFPRASIVIHAKLKNGESWQTEGLNTSNAGMVWLQIPEKTFTQINQRTLTFDIRHKGKQLMYVRPTLEARGGDAYRLVITARQSDANETPLNEEHQPPVNEPEAPSTEVPTRPPQDDALRPENDNSDVQPAANLFSVCGQILSADGKPKKALEVAVFDREICDEYLLAVDATDARGRYRVEYDSKLLKERGKDRLDVLVRVYEKYSDKAEPLVSSPLFLNAAEQLEVNLTNDSSYRGKPLFEHVQEKLQAHIKRGYDCIETEDIWIIADRTRITPRTIAQFVGAQRMLDSLGIEKLKNRAGAVLFALLRCGLLGYGHFSGMHRREIRRTVNKAAARGWIAEHNYQPAIALLLDSQVKYAGENGILGEKLFTLSGVPKSKRDAAQKAIRSAQGGRSALMQTLVKQVGISESKAEKLLGVNDLFRFFGNQLELIDTVYKATGAVSIPALSNVEQEQWREILTSVADTLPLLAVSDNKEQRISEYAAQLDRSMQLAFPSGYFIQRLSSVAELSDEVLGFFEKNTSIDLDKQRIENVFGPAKSSKQKASLRSLQQIQGLYHALPVHNRVQEFGVLWSSGFRSLDAIAHATQSEFRQQVGEKLDSVKAADQIYKAANSMTAKAVSLQAKLTTLKQTTTPPDAPSSQVGSTSNAGFPSLPNLFGSVVSAECEHCESLTSPSAYLVDLMSFLKRANDRNGASAYELLKGTIGGIDYRRPDIENLELSCANSDTPLPYIDLVLEVLENAVLRQMPVNYSTEVSAEEVAAKPEHTNAAAYEALKTLVYPWILPFDIDGCTSNTYLNKLGIPRYELLESLYGGRQALVPERAAADYLGMSAFQAAIVSFSYSEIENHELVANHSVLGGLTSDKFLSLFWGLEDKPIDALEDLAFCLERSGLEQDLFSQILATEFVNPAGLVKISSGGQLVAFDNDFFDRFHRFARLLKWTGLPIEDLDLAMSHAQTTEPSDRIEQVANSFRLKAELVCSIRDLYGVFSVNGDESFTALAELAGFDSGQLKQLGDMVGIEPQHASGAWQLCQAMQQINDSNFDISSLYYLISDSIEGELFSLEAAQSALSSIQLRVLEDAALDVENPDEVRLNSIAEELALQCDVQAATGHDVVSFVNTLGSQLNHPVLSVISANDFANFDLQAGPGEELATNFVAFWKQLYVMDRLALSANELFAVAVLAPAMGWLNVSALGPSLDEAPKLSLTRLFLLWRYQQLNQQYFASEPALGTNASLFIQILLVSGEQLFAQGSSDGYSVEELLQGLNTWFEWDEIEWQYLISEPAMNCADWKNFQLVGGLPAIADVITLASSNNISQEELWALTTESPDEIHALLERKYSYDWLELSAEIHDSLREQQRDALVGFLTEVLQRLFKKPISSDELYSFYLIDTEMSSCFDTSRAKQAIASVQLYIQRILLGLEPNELRFDDASDIKQWEWRKNYRVWEANRKVFVFPENWLEPELRDDKTELFVQLESQLLQDEVREDTALSAITEYCRQLDKIANLEVSALYQDFETADNKASDLHVFSRTRAQPHRYYHCVRDIHGTWSNWNKVDADIEGDHLVPLKFNNKLYLVWPSFTERQVDDQSKDLVVLDISLNWVEQDIDKSWSAKKMISQSIESTSFAAGSNQRSKIFCVAEVSEKEVEIQLWSSRESWPPASDRESSVYLGKFVFDPCAENFMVDAPADKVTWTDYSDFVSEEVSRHNQKIDIVGALEFVDDYHASDLILAAEHEDSMVVLPIHVHPLSAEIDVFAYEGAVKPFIVDRQFTLVPDFVVREPPDQDDPTPIDPPGSQPTTPHFPYPIDPIIPGWRDIPEFIEQELSEDWWGGEQELQFQANQPSLVFSGASLPVANLNGAAVMTSQMLTVGQNQIRSASAQTFQVGSVGTYVDVTRDRLHAEIQLRSDDTFRFTALYHPFTCAMIRQLARKGTQGLYKPDWLAGGDDQLLYRQVAYKGQFFQNAYEPEECVVEPLPVEQFEFTYGAPYATYNWEVFYHAPMLIAKQLMLNQQYETAQQWLHYVFDPTSNDNAPINYWRFRPFFLEQQEINAGDYTDIESLADYDSLEFDAQVVAWEQHPFNPHAIARMRRIAYMRNTVMVYLDNLIAWGDKLFRRDTMESLNEATQLYIYASQLLGPRPIQLPQATEKKSHQTVKQILDDMQLSTAVTGTTNSQSPQGAPIGVFLSAIFSFCLPDNERLLDYWDTIADRLFKIRNCQNIDGVTRTLALYEPPIDPALLVRAAANGIDIGTILDNLAAPAPCYRFSYIVQRANEFLSDVKSLGTSLLSALEKKDAESLSQIRSNHDFVIAQKVLEARKEQVTEAETALESLQSALNSINARVVHYTELLSDKGHGEGVIESEEEEQKKLKGALHWEILAGGIEGIAAILAAIPQAELSVPPATSFGGQHLGAAARAGAAAATLMASEKRFSANKAATEASRTRRNQEWQFQLDSANRDLERTEIDILSAEIRIALAQREVRNQETQLAHSDEADLFLRDKFTNDQLYSWMITELSTTYFAAFQLAEELARGAEKAYNFELNLDTEASFIASGYWDSLKKGLLAGEKLALDLRRMELAYINNNKRQNELTKSISMRQFAPEQWLRLRETGECSFSIPEFLFDLDYPGHYARRIKSVSLTVPCIAGPYTSLACELRLDQAAIRNSPDLQSAPITDTQAQTLAMSSGQNDAGVFQLDFNDPRYLPFEGSGVISDWTLSLGDPQLAQFDFATISDVIIQMNFTSKTGSEQYKNEVINRNRQAMNWLEHVGQIPQLLSLKAHFPNHWPQFIETGEILIEFSDHATPFFIRERLDAIESSTLVLESQEDLPSTWTAVLTDESAETTFAEISSSIAADLGTAHGHFTPAGWSPAADDPTESPPNLMLALNNGDGHITYKLSLQQLSEEARKSLRDVFLLSTVSTRALPEIAQ